MEPLVRTVDGAAVARADVAAVEDVLHGEVDVDGPYQWLHTLSKTTGSGIAYETSNPYLACSSESTGGICPHMDWSCSAENVARTCSTFSDSGGKCVGLKHYPNATVSEYGSVEGADNMAKEIMARGPIACGIDANPLRDYTIGIIKDASSSTDHVISVVGWGTDATEGLYWLVRNSWGEYWGEHGFARVADGAACGGARACAAGQGS